MNHQDFAFLSQPILNALKRIVAHARYLLFKTESPEFFRREPLQQLGRGGASSCWVAACAQFLQPVLYRTEFRNYDCGCTLRAPNSVRQSKSRQWPDTPLSNGS